MRFLVSNSVAAEDWKRIKIDQPNKAIQLIDLFSDAVFDKTLERAQYLKRKTPKELQLFHCRKDKIILIGLTLNPASPLDLTQEADLMSAIQTAKDLSLYRSEKIYTADRLQDMFQMMESGCLIGDGELFGALEKIYQQL